MANEDERVIQELRDRAKRLLDDADRAYADLANDEALTQAIDQWYAAGRIYAAQLARGPERETLLQLASRVGQRQIIFARRGEAAVEKFAVEQELKQINTAIGCTQFVVGLGKLAEVALSLYGWVGKAREAAKTSKFLCNGKPWDYAKEFKNRIDGAKFDIDGAKAIAPQANAAINGVSDKKKADYELASLQAAAYLTRFIGGMDKTGKALWDLIGTIRRLKSTKDLEQALATTLHIFKEIVDLTKNLMEFMNTKKEWVDSTGALGTVLTVLRDFMDAVIAFEASFAAFQEMRLASGRMDAAMAANDRFTGTEEDARRVLPAFVALNAERIEALALQTTNYNQARVLTDEARKAAKQIESELAASNRAVRQQKTALKNVVRRLAGKLEDMEEILTRMRYQKADLDFVSSRGGPRATVADELSQLLQRKRTDLEQNFSAFRNIAAAVQ